jgi:hypothetical protein
MGGGIAKQIGLSHELAHRLARNVGRSWVSG